MRLADTVRLLLLAAFWGGSFLFIRIAVPSIGPAWVVESRVAIATGALFVYAALFRKPMDLRARWKEYFALGLINSAVPSILISQAEVHIGASMAVILNATTPIWGALIGAIWLRDPLSPRKILGMATAMAGVIALVGWSPMPLNAATIAAVVCSLLAAFFYGIGGNYAKACIRDAPPIGMAAGSQLAAALLVLPLAAGAPHVHALTTPVVVSVALLALLSTAAGFLLYYRLVVDVGPAKALTVTFLTPVFGVIWGATFLAEGITLAKIAACAIVLVGTYLVTTTSFATIVVPDATEA